MAAYNKPISATCIRIGEVRFSYAYVFSPRKNEDGDPDKYSCQILIPKTDAAAKKLIDVAVAEAVKAGVSQGKLCDKNGKKLPDIKIKTPLRDGDEEYPDDPNYEGMWFFNATSKQKPGVRVLENGAMSEALDDEDFYSGCYGAAVVNFYPYSVSGNAGVAAGLNNVIKTNDGERLAGGHTAEQDFGDLVGGSVLD